MAKEANTGAKGLVAVTLSAEAERTLPWPERQQLMIRVFDRVAQKATHFEVIFDPEEDPSLAAILSQLSSGIVWRPYESPVPAWLRTGCRALVRPWVWLGIVRESQPVSAVGPISSEVTQHLRAGLERCSVWHVHLWDANGLPLWHAWDGGTTWVAYLPPLEVEILSQMLESLSPIRPVLQVVDYDLLRPETR